MLILCLEVSPLAGKSWFSQLVTICYQLTVEGLWPARPLLTAGCRRRVQNKVDFTLNGF